MRAEFVNPFVQAATEALERELGTEVDRGVARLQKSAYTSKEVTALIGVTGQVEGLVLFTMSVEVALSIASTMLSKETEELDDEAQSSLGDLGNAIAERASALLAEAGYASSVASPTIVRGSGVMLTTLDLNRLIVPLTMKIGEIEIQVVLREIAKTKTTAA